jgi:hypothetical protein
MVNIEYGSEPKELSVASSRFPYITSSNRSDLIAQATVPQSTPGSNVIQGRFPASQGQTAPSIPNSGGNVVPFQNSQIRLLNTTGVAESISTTRTLPGATEILMPLMRIAPLAVGAAGFVVIMQENSKVMSQIEEDILRGRQVEINPQLEEARINLHNMRVGLNDTISRIARGEVVPPHKTDIDAYLNQFAEFERAFTAVYPGTGYFARNGVLNEEALRETKQWFYDARDIYDKNVDVHTNSTNYNYLVGQVQQVANGVQNFQFSSDFASNPLNPEARLSDYNHVRELTNNLLVVANRLNTLGVAVPFNSEQRNIFLERYVQYQDFAIQRYSSTLLQNIIVAESTGNSVTNYEHLVQSVRNASIEFEKRHGGNSFFTADESIKFTDMVQGYRQSYTVGEDVPERTNPIPVSPTVPNPNPEIDRQNDIERRRLSRGDVDVNEIRASIAEVTSPEIRTILEYIRNEDLPEFVNEIDDRSIIEALQTKIPIVNLLAEMINELADLEDDTYAKYNIRNSILEILHGIAEEPKHSMHGLSRTEFREQLSATYGRQFRSPPSVPESQGWILMDDPELTVRDFRRNLGENFYGNPTRLPGYSYNITLRNDRVVEVFIPETVKAAKYILNKLEILLNRDPEVALTSSISIYPYSYAHRDLDRGFVNPGSTSSQHHMRFNYGARFIEVGIFYHELGHHIAWKVYGTRIPNNEYERAKSLDNQKISDYGETNLSEDFAEAVRFYLTARDQGENALNDFRIRYPNRSKILDRIFDVNTTSDSSAGTASLPPELLTSLGFT